MSSSPRSIQLLKERPRCFLWPRTRGNGSEKKPHCENTKSPFREKLKSLFSPLVTILHILSKFFHFYLMCTDGPAAGFCVSVSYGSSGHLNAFGLCWTTNLRGMRLTGEHWYTFAILFQQSHVVLFMSPFTTFGVPHHAVKYWFLSKHSFSFQFKPAMLVSVTLYTLWLCTHHQLISMLTSNFSDGKHAFPGGSLKHTCPFSHTYLIAVGTLINPQAICHLPWAHPTPPSTDEHGQAATLAWRFHARYRDPWPLQVWTTIYWRLAESNTYIIWRKGSGINFSLV